MDAYFKHLIEQQFLCNRVLRLREHNIVFDYWENPETKRAEYILFSEPQHTTKDINKARQIISKKTGCREFRIIEISSELARRID